MGTTASCRGGINCYQPLWSSWEKGAFFPLRKAADSAMWLATLANTKGWGCSNECHHQSHPPLGVLTSLYFPGPSHTHLSSPPNLHHLSVLKLSAVVGMAARTVGGATKALYEAFVTLLPDNMEVSLVKRAVESGPQLNCKHLYYTYSLETHYLCENLNSHPVALYDDTFLFLFLFFLHFR